MVRASLDMAARISHIYLLVEIDRTGTGSGIWFESLAQPLGPSIKRISPRFLDPPIPPVAHSTHLNDPPSPFCVRPVKNLRPPNYFLPVLL